MSLNVIRKGAPWGTILLAGLAGLISSLLLDQVIAVQIVDAQLRTYAEGLLTHALDVAHASRRALVDVNTSGRALCSDKDLDAMRRLSFTSEYLRDVGRLQDGKIACTALWGRLSPAIQLPPAQRIQDGGALLWADVENIGSLKVKVSMSSQGTGIVFTAPTAFKAYEDSQAPFSARLVTRDGQHVFRSYKATAQLGAPFPSPLPWYDLDPRRTTWSCDGELDICIVAAGHAGISSLSTGPVLALGLLGAMAGGSIGYAAALRSRSSISVQQQIRRALAAGRLQVVYQPLVRMTDMKVIGAEALARLTDEQGNFIPPEIFIKIAEDMGVIGQITRSIIHQSFRDRRTELSGEPEFHISINLSATDIVDSSLRAHLDQESAHFGVPPERVALEITERSTLPRDRMIAGMNMFRESGYQFYIDDFGTGYSNFAYLAQLPISGIKIDRMFIRAIGTNSINSTIVENLCAIAKKLNIQVVVEGVEAQEQAAYILGLLPDAIGQGFLYGKPMRAVSS